MRVRTMLGGFLLVLLPLCSAADELRMEPHAMIYYQVPFAGGDRNTESTFGLRFDRAMVDRKDGIEYRKLLQRPAFMDVQFSPRGMQHLSFAGTDYLKLYRAHQAAEEAAAESGTANPDAANPDAAKPDAAKPGAAKPAAAPAEDKLTMSKMLDNASPGFIIGGCILVAVVATSWGQ